MANEIFTAEDVAKLLAAAIGSGDLDCARVINEAAKRLTKCGKDVERPILFSAPMVRAILDGRKTQTRRVCKQGELLIGNDLEEPKCPYGVPGNTLWVRETWQYANWTEDGLPWIGYRADESRKLRERGISEEWSERLADIWAALSVDSNYRIDGRAADRRWRPAIHMPRWASRITLRVESVRVERVQDITEADAKAEGAEPADCCLAHYHGFAKLWESINGPRGYGWDANPWVWVVQFARI